MSIKKILLLAALFISSLSFAQNVVGKYKLQYLSYKNDTIGVNNEDSVKAFAYKIAKGQNPKMLPEDSAKHAGMIVFSVAIFKEIVMDMKENKEYWLDGVMVNDQTSAMNGTYKVKGKVLTVTTKRGKEEVYDIITLNGITYLARANNGMSFLFKKQ